MTPAVIKACDLWHGRVFRSPQSARVYSPKGISPALMANRSGGSREIKFLVICNPK